MSDPQPFFRIESVAPQDPAPAPPPPPQPTAEPAPQPREPEAPEAAMPPDPSVAVIDAPAEPPQDPVTYRTGRVIQDDPDSYFRIMLDTRKQEQAEWEASMRVAVQTQPDLYAEAERLAKEAGVPVDTALRKTDELRKLAEFRQARDLVVEGTNPTLYRSFRNFEFQRKAIDDLANLSWQERWDRGYGKGQLMVERGRIATRIRDGKAQPGDEDRLAWIEGEFNAGGHEGFLEWLGETFGQMRETLPQAVEGGMKGAALGAGAALVAGQLGPQALAPEEAFTVPALAVKGFLAGFTAEAFVQSYVVEGGNSYKDMLNRGIDAKDARWWSRFVGLGNAAIEVGTVGLVSKPFVNLAKRKLGLEVASLVTKPGRRIPPFLGEYFRQAGIQTGQEMSEELVSAIGEWAASQKPGQAPTFGDTWDRVIGVAQKTLVSQSVLGLLPAGIHYRNEAAAAKRALRVRSYVEGLAGVAVDGKLLARDPAAFEEHHRKLIEDNPDVPSHFYVNARDLGDVLRQKDKEAVDSGAPLEKSAAYQIDGIIPGFAAELEQAEANNGDVVIPAEVYLARIAPLPDLNNAVAPLLRDDPDGVALGKAQEVLRRAEEQAKQAEADEQIAAAVERGRLDGLSEQEAMAAAGVKGERKQAEFLRRLAEQRLDASRREVESTIAKRFEEVAQPLGGAKTTKRERATAARYASLLVSSLAAREGVSPMQFWKDHELAVGEMVDEMAGTGVLRQPAARLDSPEFKAWFGKSKVVDESGSPLRLFHGTAHSFDEFNIRGLGVWFSADPSISGAYSEIAARTGGEAQVMPVYVRIENPAPAEALYNATQKADEAGKRGVAKYAMVREILQAEGYDGIVDGKGIDKMAFVAFSPEQIKSVNNRGTFDPTDRNMLRQPDRGGYRPQDLRLLWTKRTDASTLFHELGHWYVDMLRRVAAREGASAQVRADWAALLKRWGVADMAAWDALSPQEQAKHLEDFTYNLEDYLATGKAPTPELQGLFDRIRVWMTRVYEFVRTQLNDAYRKQFGVDLPALTPELRDVFDRMLASQQAIDSARDTQNLASVFLDEESAKAAGIDEETRARLLAAADAVDAEAGSELTKQGLAGVRSEQIKRSKEMQDRARQVARLRRKVRAEVEAEVRALPEVRAMEHLRGTVVDAEGKERSAKLDTDSVKAVLGVEIVDPKPSEEDLQRIRAEAAASLADDQVQAAFQWLRDGLVDQADGTTKADPEANQLDPASVRAALGLPAQKTVKGKSMVARIRELGGIRVEGYPGDLRGEFRIPFVFRKNGGMSWEQMAEALAADGYGGERYDSESDGNVDNTWLLDALANAAQGEVIYPQEFDESKQAMQQEYEAWAQTDPGFVAAQEEQAKRNVEMEALATRLARRGLVARRLDAEIAAAIAAEKKAQGVSKLPPARRAEVVKQVKAQYRRGISVDYAAAMFGFRDKEAMLVALSEAPLRDEALKAETRRRTELDAADRAARQGQVAASAKWLLDTLTTKDGQDPDMVAEAFGFETAKQMLQQMMDTGEVEKAIDARTEQRVAEEFEVLLSAQAQKRAVDEAIHSAKRANLIAAELQAMQKGRESIPEMVAAAKEAARIILLRTPVERISVGLFTHLESRAAKAVVEALKKGDGKAAIAEQRNRLLNHFLAKQAAEIKDEVDAFTEKLVPRVFGDDKKIQKARDFDIVTAARAVLARYGFGDLEQALAPSSYLDRIKQYDPELWSELDEEIRQATFDPQPWARLPLERWRKMADAVQHLWDRAWSSRTLGQRREVQQVVAETITRAEAGPLGKVPAEQALQRNDTVAAKLARGLAWLKIFESWALWVDGGTPGPWTRYLYRPLANAATQKRIEAAKLKKRYLEILESMGPMRRGWIDASEWLGTGAGFDGVEELLGAVQHIGNYSNKNKMIGGWLWGAQLERGRFDHSRWDAFFLAMQQNGTITEAHMRGIQAIWDLNDQTLKPAAQRVNREFVGKYFDEIQAQPVQTIWGTLRGGYVPAKPDPGHTLNADLKVRSGLEAIQDGELAFSASMPIGVSNKFTVTRNGAIRPLLLDLRLGLSHIDDALQFIHLQQPVRAVARLLRDQTMLNYLNTTAPGAVDNILLPMLERVALDRISRPVTLGWLANWMRRSATLQFLAGSMRNILQQFTGLINATHYAPAGDLVRAAWSLAKPGRGQVIRQILDASDFMRDRSENQAEQILDGIERQLDPGVWRDAHRRLASVALFPQAWTQNQVDMATWWAKYNASLRELVPLVGHEAAHAEAVQRADGAVRMSQGSRTALDVSHLFGQNAWVRLVTQFGDYSNVALQPILQAQSQRDRMVALLRVLIVPSIGASAIALALSRGRELEDEDGDGEYVDQWASFWGGGILRSGLGMVPIAGPAVASLLLRRGQADDRVAPFPAWSTVEAVSRTVVNLIEQRNWRPQTSTDVAAIASAITGLPLAVFGKGAAYAQKVREGTENPANWVAFLMGIVNGR